MTTTSPQHKHWLLSVKRPVTGITVRPCHQSGDSHHKRDLHDNLEEDENFEDKLEEKENETFQTLLFSQEEVQLLKDTRTEPSQGANDVGSHGACRFQLDPFMGLSLPLGAASCPAYDAASDSVFFAVNRKAIMQLDSDNIVDFDLLVGSSSTERTGDGSEDGNGRGAVARFLNITALAPDGKGTIYIADSDRIRRLDVASRYVSTLPGSSPKLKSWLALSYDMSCDVLLAATESAVCIIDTTTPATLLPFADNLIADRSSSSSSSESDDCCSHAGSMSGGGGSGRSASVRLVAGDWMASGFADGAGTVSRFVNISALVVAGGRQIYLLDGQRLRCLNAADDFQVSTTLGGMIPHIAASACLLPNGDLLVGYDDAAQLSVITEHGLVATRLPRAPQRQRRQQRRPSAPSPALVALRAALAPWTAFRAEADGDGDDGGGRGSGGGCSLDNSAPVGTIVIRVGAGTSATFFAAHRAALCQRSEYFQQLLNPGGGGRIGSGGEVVLDGDADPEAFRWLLSYMYCGELFVPTDLLRPAVALAEKLLLPAACSRELQSRLLLEVTPGSVLSDLLWAQWRGLRWLVPRLKSFLLQHRRHVTLGVVELEQLIEHFPKLAASLVRKLARAV